MRTKYRCKDDNQRTGKTRPHAGIWKERLYKRRHRRDSERQHSVPAQGACHVAKHTCHPRVTHFKRKSRLLPGRIDKIVHAGYRRGPASRSGKPRFPVWPAETQTSLTAGIIANSFEESV